MSESLWIRKISKAAIMSYVFVALFIITTGAFWFIAGLMIFNPPKQEVKCVECAICHEEIDDYAREIDGIKGPVCVRCDK